MDSLLVRVGDGDRDAFAALYDQLSQTVYAMSLRRGHAPWASAEVTYDVFLRAWRQAPAYDPAVESGWAWFSDLILEVIDRPADGAPDAPAACFGELAAAKGR